MAPHADYQYYGPTHSTTMVYLQHLMVTMVLRTMVLKPRSCFRHSFHGYLQNHENCEKRETTTNHGYLTIVKTLLNGGG